jgi:hypothetical protein
MVPQKIGRAAARREFCCNCARVCGRGAGSSKEGCRLSAFGYQREFVICRAGFVHLSRVCGQGIEAVLPRARLIDSFDQVWWIGLTTKGTKDTKRG